MVPLQNNTQIDHAIEKPTTHTFSNKIHKIWLNALNFFRVIGIMIRQVFGLSKYKIVLLDPKNLSKEMQQKLKDFEKTFVYPFDDSSSFQIIHGKNDNDYLSFFKRMGDCKFYAAINKKERVVTKTINGEEKTFSCKAGEIAAVGCGVLRTFATDHKKTVKAWYICDLKVGEKFRGDHLPVSIIQRSMWRYLQCPRGYGICMNPIDKSKPAAVNIWDKHGGIKGGNQLTVNLYNLNYGQIKQHRSAIEEALGETITFKSTKGTKEFEIFSNNDNATRSEWKLLHIQYGPKGEKTLSESNMNDPQENHDHMVAAIEGSSLDKKLQSIKLEEEKQLTPSTTATLRYHGLSSSFFDDKILTNEI